MERLSKRDIPSIAKGLGLGMRDLVRDVRLGVGFFSFTGRSHARVRFIAACEAPRGGDARGERR